jgi:hypothetical protein
MLRFREERAPSAAFSAIVVPFLLTTNSRSRVPKAVATPATNTGATSTANGSATAGIASLLPAAVE